MNIVKRRLPPKLSTGILAGFFLEQLSFLLKESVFLYYCVSARSRILIVYLLILTQSVCEVVTVLLQYPYAIVAQVSERYGRGSARPPEEAR